jgi:large subunit ribosomal protein L23
MTAMPLKPRVSEKAYDMAQHNVYVMQVPMDANKHTVAQAIREQFSVTVMTVNTVVSKGKQKRTVRKGGRQAFGRRTDTKKAYVTLKAGETIPIFASEEDDKKTKAKTTVKGKK